MHGTQGVPRWGETDRGLSGLPHGEVSFHPESEANLRALTSLCLAGQSGNTDEASHQGRKSGPPLLLLTTDGQAQSGVLGEPVSTPSCPLGHGRDTRARQLPRAAPALWAPGSHHIQG